MRHSILTYVLILSCLSVKAQQVDSWVSFWNKDSTLIGFKDKTGRVKIEPKFMGFTMANRFDYIIAAMEEKNGTYESYYLTKSGKIVGRDSLHIFDNGADCENEGFIRFRDGLTDKVGMFNSKGEIAIPAEYNDLTRVRNGFIVALKGAEKKYLNADNHSGDNHYSWTGGTEYLIDTANQIVIENFKLNEKLNFFSKITEAQPSKNPIRQSFAGINGQYVSFIDYEKEFKQWLNLLLNSFTIQDLTAASYNKITYWKEPIGWINEPRGGFINRNFELIKNRLLEIKKKNADYFISIDGLNPYLFETDDFKEYYNNCGEAKEWQYPVMNVVITHQVKKDIQQDHFEFLRTEKGYKLVSLTLRNAEL